jgi:hypothetical protein
MPITTRTIVVYLDGALYLPGNDRGIFPFITIANMRLRTQLLGKPDADRLMCNPEIESRF